MLSSKATAINMAPSDNVKIAFGVVAAVGVVFLSYIFFRILGAKPDDHPPKRKSKTRKPKPQPVVEKKICDEASTSGVPKKEEVAKVPTTSGDLEVTVPKSVLPEQDNSNQTSFIIIDQPAHDALPGEEGPASSKKSDRSSDDSSFDVVEAGGEEDDEDKKQQEETLGNDNLDGSGARENEGSMIIVESEPSTIEASGSSFYHSADESLPRERLNPTKSDKETAMSETGESNMDYSYVQDEDNSESVSTSDSEPTVMYSVDGKLVSRDASSDATATSTTTVDTKASTIKDSLATGDERKVTLDNLSTSDPVESVSGKSPTASVPEGTVPASAMEKDVTLGPHKILTSAETARTLTMCQNSASTVSKNDLCNLVELLRTNNPVLQPAVLDCIIRVSVFTHNMKHLHTAGCGLVLSQRVQKSCKDVLQGDAEAQQALEAFTGALTNLSLDPTFMPQLEGSVSPLVDVLLLDSVPDSVYMSALRPLTNLSTDAGFPHLCQRAINQLYALLDKRSDSLRTQCLKVLVNLSLVQDLVPYLLSAKAPETLLELVEASTSNDVVLRTITMLGHIFFIISRDKISASSLPTSEKAESPYTMFTALCGGAELPPLRNKIYCLSRHDDEEIKEMASKVYHFISLIRK